MAHNHNSKLSENEPSWGSVDKTALPRNAFADMGEEGKKSTWGYPHHHIVGGTRKNDDGIWIDGDMYLHRGGLNAAWAAAQGARTGNKASQDVQDHLQQHRRAIGLEDTTDAAVSHFLPHIAGRIFNVPLAVTPQRLDIIIRALNSRIGAEMWVHPFFSIEPEKNALVDLSIPKRYRKDEQNADGIGVIPIHDTLVYHSFGSVQPVSGHLTSYEEIKNWYIEANTDSSIHTILLAIDSPGGEVAGLLDLVDYISATKSKPIYASIDEDAYSAAYTIASVADRIFIPRTGGAGSIGIIAYHVDMSEANKMAGVRYTPIFAGARKNDFSQDEPLNSEAYRVLKNQIDAIYDMTTKIIARNRKIPQYAIRNTEAGIFQGKSAIDMGLADEIKSFDEVIEMIKLKNGNRKGNKIMSEMTRETTQTTQTVQQVVQQAQANPVNAEKIKDDAITMERARIANICNTCKAMERFGLPVSFANQLIESGCSISEANQKILVALAIQSDQNQIASTVGALNSGVRNTLIENAKQRLAVANQKGPLI